MKSAICCWLLVSVSVMCGMIMLLFSALFIRLVYYSLSLSHGQAAFSSLLLAVLLLMGGGGLLCSTVARFRKEAR